MIKKTTGADEKKGDANGCYYDNKNYIHKSVIENKIEELFEEMEECNIYDEEDNEDKRILSDMIVLLKEILNERN